MFKQLATAGLLMAASIASQAATFSYGWEDGTGTVLGEFGSGMQYTNINAGAAAHSGTNVLLVEDINNTSGTPQGYLAWVTGLNDGDTIDASFWAFETAPNSAPSVRIWGHYTTSDVDSYGGSAGGNNTFSSGNGWDQLSHQWTFDSDGGDRNGLIVEVRFYDSSSVPTGSALVDDLEIMVSSNTANVTFPGTSPVPVPAAVWLFGSALVGLVSMRRKA